MLHKRQLMGSDNIPTFIAQDSATFWAEPLCKIMNKCLSDGIFPTQWKNTRIVPVFKSGNAASVENYRPISIIPVFAKIFEIILHKKLYYEFKPKISHMQHGFIQNKSTTSNLLILTQQISKNLNSNIQTDVIYTDFKKAFDSVDHNILLKKLANIGCSVKLVQLFHSYLQERKLSVQYRGQISKEFVATSGVPQGANLAALLFSVYVNDLAYELKTGALLYADDMKIYRNIRNKGDAEKLQMQLDKIATWCKYNGIQLNVKKCSVLTYSRACSPYIYNYKINKNALVRATKIKDLGVVFKSTLSFKDHILEIIQKAYRSMGMIIRNCKDFKDIDTLKLLFITYVRPILEYGFLIWNPHNDFLIKELEKIQRKYLKWLYYKRYGLYPPMGINQCHLLNEFNLLSLQNRRSIGDVCFLKKLINGNIDCPDLLKCMNFYVPRSTSRYRPTFYTDGARKEVLKYAPINRMCEEVNKCKLLDIFHCTKKDIQVAVLSNGSS